MTGRQLVNDPQDLVGEALEGLELSQGGRLRWNRDSGFVIRADGRRPFKVGVLSGGGSGHAKGPHGGLPRGPFKRATGPAGPYARGPG